MKNPGCYGAPSVFSPKSTTCNACPAFGGCITVSKEKLETFPESEGKKSLMLQYALVIRDAPHIPPDVCMAQHIKASVQGIKRGLTGSEQEVCESLPVNVKRRYKTIVAGGLLPGILSAIKNAENPFSLDGHRYLHVAFALLLTGKVTKAGLRTAYIEQLGWSKETSGSHVSVVWKLLPALGVVENSKETITIIPRLFGQTSI